ncbi:Nucleoporin nup45 OS=Schizosaccharomyces pombe (strain 972 / ATCC 24843) GN=nup45 PE=1 SV=2 [Rhizoctonia solani AG-1 IB]|uniref:Nucleoporin nup45 n=1 Tax=Thanatephorus cucumeris (strain AG1-IB / isolate 7/3/14) TaxID=1108050 RepID=A0A0B7FGF4_THACB|nr:Nucleoporin nup45 OS=Schizosaccharomyces pombe (strain 972 / ATCC 24843) GN=nup45 PE=1 SV=2 [Rhizoctonia solani AG-1 IB]
MFNFGSAAAKPATTGFGGSLFGQSNTTQTAPATTGGLFGATGTTGQPTSAPATATGGLFGSTQPGAGTNTATGGGLFGAQQPATNTATGTTGGLFGAQPAATNTTTTGGFFGAQTAANTTTGGGLFGAQPGANAATGTTGSSFGFGAPAATATPQPAPQASGPFTRTTKFNDLPDAQKKVFEDIESFIQGRVQISVELKAQKLGEEIAKEQAALDELTKSLSAASSALSSDRLAADDQRTKTDRNLQDALIATRIIDGFTKPQQMGGYLTSYANFPLEYFTRQVEEMKERVQRYKSTMEQIERKLAQVYEANSAQPAQPSPQAIANALRAQHASFMALAARTAEIDAAVQKHKTVYTARWRAQTGSARDPFAPASKEDDTLDALMSMSMDYSLQS